MKTKTSLDSAATALSAFVAGPAQAVTMIAGWDFSQCAGDGFLSLDGDERSPTAGRQLLGSGSDLGAGPSRRPSERCT